ncbi:MAG: cbb3-type cytochrome c oxidase subunit II [Phycisphaerae bacterium]
MLESKPGVFVIAGVGFFVLALLVMGLLPSLILIDQPEKTIDDLTADGIVPEFIELAEKFPERFARYYPQGPGEASFGEALTLGRHVYVAEGCWHCHSQQVRPVSEEDQRWGPVARSGEYQNVLQRPVLFGTRRVGPDLSREGGRRSNDWHIAHFFNPVNVSPTSVMPRYTWFYDEAGYPNARGMAVITYVQWLGSWLPEYPYYFGEGPQGPEGAPK